MGRNDIQLPTFADVDLINLSQTITELYGRCDETRGVRLHSQIKRVLINRKRELVSRIQKLLPSEPIEKQEEIKNKLYDDLGILLP